MSNTNHEIQNEIYELNHVKNTGIVILVVAIVFALLIGGIYPSPTQEYLEFLEENSGSLYSRSFYGDRTGFNWQLALVVGISGVMVSSLFFAIGALVDRQNVIIRIMLGQIEIPQPKHVNVIPGLKPIAPQNENEKLYDDHNDSHFERYQRLRAEEEEKRKRGDL